VREAPSSPPARAVRDACGTRARKDRRIAWGFIASVRLRVDGIPTGRSDRALARLTTVMRKDETEAEAEARLMDLMRELSPTLPRFIPEG
jgi:hypothetical protein